MKYYPPCCPTCGDRIRVPVRVRHSTVVSHRGRTGESAASRPGRRIPIKGGKGLALESFVLSLVSSCLLVPYFLPGPNGIGFAVLAFLCASIALVAGSTAIRGDGRIRATAGVAISAITLLLIMLGWPLWAAFDHVGEGPYIEGAKYDIKSFSDALELYKVRMGTYPTTEEGLKALAEKPTDPELAKKWKAPMLDSVRTDQQGRNYRYECPGTHNPQGFDIVAVGDDGVLGTKDDAHNW